MGSVVIGGQRPLDGRSGGPVVPDGGGHGQQPLGDSGVDAFGGAAAVAFQVELALEGVVDRFDPLADPADRAVPWCLVAAVRTYQAPCCVGGGKDCLVEWVEKPCCNPALSLASRSTSVLARPVRSGAPSMRRVPAVIVLVCRCTAPSWPWSPQSRLGADYDLVGGHPPGAEVGVVRTEGDTRRGCWQAAWQVSNWPWTATRCRNLGAGATG